MSTTHKGKGSKQRNPGPLTSKVIAALKPGTNENTGKKTPCHAFDAANIKAVAGLMVRCQPSGRKYFYYQFRRPALVKNRKTGEKVLSKYATTTVCLGLTDDMSIPQAREKARTARDTARAAIRAGLTGDNVVSRVHEALNSLTAPASQLEAKQKAKQDCPTALAFIDKEYIDYKRTNEGLKTFQDDREIQRLKYVLSVLSQSPKRGRSKNLKGDPTLNLLNMKLDEIDGALIRKWKVARLKRPSDRTGKPPSRVTVERELMMMRSMFNEAFACNYIAANPLIDKRRKNKKRKKPKSKQREGLLTTKQEARLFATLAERETRIRERRKAANEFAEKEGGRQRNEYPDDKFVDFLQPIILIAMHTGLRLGEIAALRWKDVTLQKKSSVEGKSYLSIPDTKSGEPLHMPLSPVPVQVLRKWKSWPGENVTSIDKDGLVFCDYKGKQLVDIRRYWLPVFQQAGLPRGYRFHDLRHHFASKLASMGQPLFAIQVLLNHSDPRMTERYAKHAPEYLQSVVDGLAKDSQWTP